MRALVVSVAGGLLAALLAGCSSSGVSKLVCPMAMVAPDLGSYAAFGPGPGRNLSDILVGAKFEGVSNTCHRDDGGIGIETKIILNAVRSSPDLHQSSVPFFVALVDAQRNIVAKKTFDLVVEFVPRQSFRKYQESITEHLPLSDTALGGNYAVVIGFQLTPDQLHYNRTHRGG